MKTTSIINDGSPSGYSTFFGLIFGYFFGLLRVLSLKLLSLFLGFCLAKFYGCSVTQRNSVLPSITLFISGEILGLNFMSSSVEMSWVRRLAVLKCNLHGG